MAVMDQSRALAAVIACPVRWRFQLTRQRGEQNLACSRRGVNGAPHCAQFLDSAIAVYGKPDLTRQISSRRWHRRENSMRSLFVHPPAG